MNGWIDGSLNYSELIQVFRVILALILGACIGFEREKYGRPAGLRTHMIVCVASALAMLISMFAFESGDPARLAAQVISGIGFIGAGTIIRGDKDITGITTAATIWICAIIGLACGGGYYFGAIITTVFSLVILSCFTKIESKLSKQRNNTATFNLVLKSEENIIQKMREFLDSNGVVLSELEYKHQVLDGEKVVKVTIDFARHTKVSDLNLLLSQIDKEFQPLQCKVVNEGYSKNKK